MPAGRLKIRRHFLGKYGFAWVTICFFAISLLGHWIFGWFAHVRESQLENRAPEFSAYVMEVGRDTLENWQSEFLQLLWQVAGLAWLLHLGSPQSKEGDERKEAKLDELLRAVAPEQADRIIAEINRQYPLK